jgi:hypothetical protein
MKNIKYEFEADETENGNGTYQLVEIIKGWFWNTRKKRPVHMEVDPWDKPILTAEDHKGSASNESSADFTKDSIVASQLYNILKNLNIPQRGLLEAKLPASKYPGLIDNWLTAVNKIYAGRR